MKARTKLLLGVGIAALALVGPSAATAQLSDDSPSLVTGTALDELSLTVAPPSLLNLKYSAPATGASAVTVLTTVPWTLQISDQDTTEEREPDGKMYKCGDTGTSLTNALEWKTPSSSFTALTANPAPVASGTLLDLGENIVNVTYQQELDQASDEVAAGDCYRVTVTYTVTGP